LAAVCATLNTVWLTLFMRHEGPRAGNECNVDGSGLHYCRAIYGSNLVKVRAVVQEGQWKAVGT
jgi:hypothetical protein